MKKNYKMHLRLESDLVDKLKKEADNQMITVSELCRKKLRELDQLTKIEILLKDINKKLENEN